MINSYRNVQLSSIIFYLNFTITIFVGIFFVPLYINEIGLKNYGAWLVLTSVLQIFSSFDPGFATVFEQRFSVLLSKKEYNTLVTTLILAILMIGVLVIIIFFIGWIAYPYIIKFSNLTEYAEKLKSSYLIALLGTALLIGSYGFNGIVNGFQKIIYSSILQLTTNLLGLITLLILIYNGFGVLALAISVFFRGFFSFLMPLVFFRFQYININIKPTNYLKQLKLLGGVFTFTSVSRFLGVLVMNLDSVITSKFYSTTEVNIIVFTKKIPTFLFSAFDIPVSSILPTLSYLSSNVHNYNKLKSIIGSLLSLYSLTILIFACFFILFNNMILSIWLNNSNLIAAHWINFMIIIGISVSALGHLIVKISTSIGFITKASKIVIIQNLIMLPSLYFSTKYYGLIGLIATPIVLISIFSICIPGFLILSFFASSKYSVLKLIWYCLKRVLPIFVVFYFLKYFLFDFFYKINQTTNFELGLSVSFLLVIFTFVLTFFKEKVYDIKMLLNE